MSRSEFTAYLIIFVIAACLSIWIIDRFTPTDRSSSFVGYSQSCWQIGDTLHVVTAKGDTVRFDLSKFDNNETNTTTSN